MGNGLGIKEKDLHGLSGSGFRSEIILANINKNSTQMEGIYRTITSGGLDFLRKKNRNQRRHRGANGAMAGPLIKIDI